MHLNPNKPKDLKDHKFLAVTSVLIDPNKSKIQSIKINHNLRMPLKISQSAIQMIKLGRIHN